MALFFNGTSQYLICQNPVITAHPFTVGMWINLQAAGTVQRSLFCLSDTAVTNHYYLLRMTTAETVSIVANAGGTETIATATNPIVAGNWAFVIARFVSNAQRRISVVRMGSPVLNNSSSSGVSTAVLNADTITIGCLYTSAGASEFWNGSIAEFWLAQGDISSSADNVNVHTVMDYALRGPFNRGNVSVVDYMSLRRGFPNGEGFDFHRAGATYPLWSAIGGPTLVSHTPLPADYRKPVKPLQPMVI